MPELSISTPAAIRPDARVGVRRPEWISIIYFTYTAILAAMDRVGLARVAFAACLPVAIWGLAQLEETYSRPWTRIGRLLLPTALILVAYEQLDWFHRAPLANLQQSWVVWDRHLLDGGLRGFIEAFGSAGPYLLDTCYLLLYTIPPLTVVALLLTGHRDRIDQFLYTLLAGTFAAYALIPHFPTLAPRIAFPYDQLPHIQTPVRLLNLFVLDHLDIATSVFPSGHVAVAFSSAWGLRRALPERPAASWALLVFACIVFAATIYDRYHYAADGAASVILGIAAWKLSERSDRDA